MTATRLRLATFACALALMMLATLVISQQAFAELATTDRAIAEGTNSYEADESNYYQFTPKETGDYCFADNNIGAVSSYAFSGYYVSSSSLSIYDGEAEEPFYSGYFGYDGTAASYQTECVVRLEAGKTYRVVWYSELGAVNKENASFRMGRLWAKAGSTFTKSGVKYKVTNANTREVAVAKAKSVKRWNERFSVSHRGINYSITSIGPKAFSGNKKLVSFDSGYNIEGIGAKAFAGCVKLKHVGFKDSVKKIGKSAFSKCKKLKAIAILGVPKFTKKSVKGCFKGSRVKYVLMQGLDFDAQKKCKKLYEKKLFSKKNCGRTIKAGREGPNDTYLPLLKVRKEGNGAYAILGVESD